jgi:hypothetical protein
MKRLPLLVAIALLAGAVQAQPLDAPPPTKDAPPPTVIEAQPLAEPDAGPALPPKHEVLPETRIEQRRVGTRVREIIVTPAWRSYSYTIENREGQRPLSPQDLASGLSTPRFLKFEF